MTNFVNSFENVVCRRGLYCVWVPVHENGRAHLEARWIDPKADFVDLTEHGEMQEVSEREEEEAWPSAALQLV